MSALPFVVKPFLYINGLELSNPAVNPDEVLNIATGQCRDSTDVFQITVDSALTVSNLVSGLGGLDTGVVAADTLYAVHIVADPVTQQLPQAMISLSATAPLLPFGYSAFRHIGYVRTDATSDFLLGFWSGNNNSRLFMYDAPIATAVTAGASTTDAAVSLATFVPALAGIPVWIKFAMTPAAASRTLTLKTFGATGAMYQATSQVTSVVLRDSALVLTALNSTAPSIEYLWSAGGGDAVAIDVAGYQFYI
ncbi:MAG: hypothetical protein ACRC1W_12225 [Shewanella sp.]